MYESEVNSAREKADQLSADVIRSFTEGKGKVRSRTVLPWSEHCTECVWPTCYSSCDLYVPREDGKCRRFADGMVRIDLPEATNSYVLKIRFKRWAKLWSPGNVRLHSWVESERIEKRDYKIGNRLQKSPLPSLVKIAAAKKVYGFKNKTARTAAAGSDVPSCFYVECYNPDSRPVRMTLIMRPSDENARIPFQKLLVVSPGFHRFRISVDEITTFIDLNRAFDIELQPNADAGEVTLYFGLMEFVVEVPELQTSQATSKKVKCVVWDLDNTLWDGILVEDGLSNLQLKPGVDAIIRSLDARGILNSIASKNNSEEALEAIKKFGLEEYFLCPQISWQPKSQGIQAIAKQLNIGRDTLVFIDDSKFEREEVRAVCPDVRAFEAEEYTTLLSRDEFQVPVTDESKQRRKLYQVEMERQTLAEDFSNDYMAFLRHCEIKLMIRPMTEENLERVHELTQRTNQMNFSGNRYDRDVLRSLLTNPDMETFVLSCEDRFGSYGVIGFSIVDGREPRMTDLMFSCRIQSKRVEHAFLAFVIRKYVAQTGKDFFANYRKSSRNAPSGQVFADLSMEEVETTDGVTLLRFPADKLPLDDNVMEVVSSENLVEQPA